jgi:hypothetical protein
VHALPVANVRLACPVPPTTWNVQLADGVLPMPTRLCALIVKDACPLAFVVCVDGDTVTFAPDAVHDALMPTPAEAGAIVATTLVLPGCTMFVGLIESVGWNACPWICTEALAPFVASGTENVQVPDGVCPGTGTPIDVWMSKNALPESFVTSLPAA